MHDRFDISRRERRRRRAARRRWSIGALIAVVLAVGLTAFGYATLGASPTASSTPKATGPAPHSPTPAKPSQVSPSDGPRPKVLTGKIVGIDPGHNGLNHTDPAFLNHIIWNGREREACDTTGTQTAGGYSEAEFNFNVALYLRADLRKDGARVVMTRQNNNGLGPCVDRRSRIINAAHANVAIDIHADGGPTWGRGFTVLEPVADKYNAQVTSSSLRFGSDVHQAFLADTPFRISNYYGKDGYISRDDLAGLNLTTVPKVLIECGNMPNSADAALLTSAQVQRKIARALEVAIIQFLTGR